MEKNLVEVDSCDRQELLALVKEQQRIIDMLTEELEQMREKNNLLNEVASLDELTRIYNRRGFLLAAESQITNPENRDKKAVVVYADMNNLKVINDQFGHEEGDYSLRMIATILQETFEDNSIIGRLGGDEFTAFMLTDHIQEKKVAQMIREKVAGITKEKNQVSDKPYFVSMSVGICEFRCGENLDLQDLLDKADVDLYIAKRQKRSNVLKNESEAVSNERN